MKHVDLFSGIGGFTLAAQWAGYETVLFVEIDPWCQKVLRKHWPNVPVIGDIRDVNEETVADAIRAERWPINGSGRCVGEGQDREGEAAGRITQCGNRGGAAGGHVESIDLLTGGFPCQPFSVAGKRGGTSDNRYLWPEMCRVIGLLKPEWVIAENVPGLLAIEGGLVFDRVLSDLEGQGYQVGTVVLPACAVNAPHRRDRVWIVAHCNGGLSARQGEQVRTGRDSSLAGREDVADTDDAETARQRIDGGQVHAVTEPTRLGGGNRPDWWAVESRMGDLADGLPAALDGHWGREPDIPRVAVGVKDRVNRLRGLGNAIVPQVAYEIMKAIGACNG